MVTLRQPYKIYFDCALKLNANFESWQLISCTWQLYYKRTKSIPANFFFFMFLLHTPFIFVSRGWAPLSLLCLVWSRCIVIVVWLAVDGCYGGWCCGVTTNVHFFLHIWSVFINKHMNCQSVWIIWIVNPYNSYELSISNFIRMINLYNLYELSICITYTNCQFV